MLTVERNAPAAMMKSEALENVVVTGAKRVMQEQLGDLKLYRVPDRTTLKSRQIKQVRLLDRQDIPVELVYGVDLEANARVEFTPANKALRTRNDAAHHLGLPLPSGTVASFLATADAPLLLDEAERRAQSDSDNLSLIAMRWGADDAKDDSPPSPVRLDPIASCWTSSARACAPITAAGSRRAWTPRTWCRRP